MWLPNPKTRESAHRLSFLSPYQLRNKPWTALSPALPLGHVRCAPVYPPFYYFTDKMQWHLRQSIEDVAAIFSSLVYLPWIHTEWKIQKWDVFPQYANAAEHINCNIFKESFDFQSFYCFEDVNVVCMAWHTICVKSYDLSCKTNLIRKATKKTATYLLPYFY